MKHSLIEPENKVNFHYTKGSAGRCFAILNALLHESPLTREELSSRTGQNKSGIHRGLHILIGFGWVRVSLCGTSYQISSSIELSFANAKIPLPETDALLPRLRQISEHYSVHLDLALFVEPGALFIEESTEANVVRSREPVSFAWSSLGHAALAHMGKSQRRRHIESYLLTACSMERQEIASSEYTERLDRILCTGFAEEESSAIVSVPVLTQNKDVLGAIAIRDKVEGRNRSTYLPKDVARIVKGILK